VPTTRYTPELLSLICSGEDGFTLRKRNNLVVVAMHNQDWHMHVADLPVRFVPSREQGSDNRQYSSGHRT